MELIFCGKGDARAVLVLYKYCPYFCGFVGICFNLVCMCILRSLADSDAFQSGRCAEHNGRPETLAIIN